MKALAPLRLGRRDVTLLAAEVFLLGAALPLYYLVRGLTHSNVEQAFERSIRLIDFEQRIGIFWEADLQSLVLPHTWLVDALNSVYLYGHLPVILILALWLYFWHRPQYLLMRNAFLISGAIGLVVHAAFPTAPPRFLPEFGFTDTVFEEYGVSRFANPSYFRNEYAAVPSLHFGWNLLVGLAVWLATRNVALRAFAVAMPLAMLASIVLTANHFILDAVAGALAVATGMALAVAVAFLVRRLVFRLRPARHDAGEDSAWHRWLTWLGGVVHPSHGRLAQRWASDI